MSLVDTEKLKSALNNDREFKITAKFWDSTLKLNIGQDAILIRVRDGEVREVSSSPSMFDSVDLIFAAPESEWREFLQPAPKPFYNDIFAAGLHRGFSWTGDMEAMFRHYPAIRRMFDVMRETATL